MRELKRVLLTPGMLLLLLALCCASAGYEWLGADIRAAYGDVYAQTVQDYSDLTAEEITSAAVKEDEEFQILFDADLFRNLESDDIPGAVKKNMHREFRTKYGKDYAAILAAVNPSAEEIRYAELRQCATAAVREQKAYLDSYPHYLRTVHSNADAAGLKIFSQNEFNRRNSLKTARDYPVTEELRLGLTPVDSFNHLTEGSMDAWCCLVFVIAAVLKFAEENRGGLHLLVYGCKNGRGRLAAKRIGILLAASFTGTVLIGLSRSVSCVLRYGALPDLSLSVQSSPEFQKFVYPLTFGRALGLVFLFRACGVFVCGLFIWLLMQAFRNFKTAVILSAAVLAAEYVCLKYIPDSFAVLPLKYANLLALIDLSAVFLKYVNVNLLGFPVTGGVLTLCFGLTAGAAAAGAAILLTAEQKPVRPVRGLPRFVRKAEIIWCNLRASAGLLGFEARKMLVFQHGFWVLAVLCVAVPYLGGVPTPDGSMYDADMAVFSGDYTGEITAKTLEAIDAALEEVRAEETGWLRDEYLEEIGAFRADVQSKYEENRGLWLMNQGPYASLFGKTEYQRKWGMLAFAAAVLLCAGLFPYEKQCRMQPLLMTAPRGRRKTVGKKILLAFLSAAAVWALLSGYEIYQTYRYYGNFFGTLRAPLASIDWFRECTADLTVWQFAVIYYLLKLLSLSAVALACCAVTGLTESVNRGVAISALVLLVPGGLSLMKVPYAEYVSPILLWSPLEVHPVCYLVCALLTVLMTVWIIRRESCPKKQL